jgi:hypothetical protein
MAKTYTQELNESLARLAKLRDAAEEELDIIDKLSADAEANGFYETAFEKAVDHVDEAYVHLLNATEEINDRLAWARREY